MKLRLFLSFLLLCALSLPTFAQTTKPLPPLSNPGYPPPPPADGKPVLWIVGDSTVHNASRTEEGWGQVISRFFDTDRIHVENMAVGGRSSRTFITEGRWDHILSLAKPGDFVLIQMGHNDGGAINDTSRARGSLHGIGEETQEIDNLLTHKHEIVHTYGWYLRKYVDDARARGMLPVICSPVPRLPKITVAAGEIEKSPYVQWAQQVAEQEKAPFIQLNGLIMRHYVGMTPEQVKTAYFTPADNTHTNPAGAELNASCVVQGICQLKDFPLKNYLELLSPTTAPQGPKR